MKVLKRLPGLPLERALSVLSGRWKAVLLYVLLDGPQRTCALEKRITGVSQKVLLEQLRALGEHGLVSRQPVANDPQAVEYRLTPLGESLRPVLDSLMAWGTHHARELDEEHRLLPCEAVVRPGPLCRRERDPLGNGLPAPIALSLRPGVSVTNGTDPQRASTN